MKKRDDVMREWMLLKRKVMGDPSLRVLKYAELYEHLFDQMSDKANPQHYFSLLLLSLIVITCSVDTSICERGFSTMNMLQDGLALQHGHHPPAPAHDNLLGCASLCVLGRGSRRSACCRCACSAACWAALGF